MNPLIHFEDSKTGDRTCSFQGKYLHSKYNPKSEGEKFAQNLQADFSPLCVFILEPALSWCAPFLRNRFPQAKLCAIRFCADFHESDSLWDHVFYTESALPLSEQLFSTLSEELLCTSLAFDWLPSKQAFPDQNLEAWKEIKKVILKARDVIGTRSYFSKRWLKNSVSFASKIEKAGTLEKGERAVIVAASGPSLKSSIPFMKKYRENFFLIAVSSAYMPLLKNGILPDLVISTDGGFWAKFHLDFPGKGETVFAIEAEGSVPKKFLSEEKIIPLAYEDGLEKDFLEAIGCPYMLSERNGTVAGTALTFAHSLTSGNIYLCGLDQAPSPAFQHTQPNALETGNAKKDFRLKNAETRITSSRFNSEKVLEIYRNWFITNSEYFSKRVSRLSDNYDYDYPLGKIREVNWEDFFKNEVNGKNQSECKKILFTEKKLQTQKDERKEILQNLLEKLSKSQKFLEEVFPMDMVLIKRELSDEKKRELQAKLDEKTGEVVKKCTALIQK